MTAVQRNDINEKNVYNIYYKYILYGYKINCHDKKKMYAVN